MRALGPSTDCLSCCGQCFLSEAPNLRNPFTHSPHPPLLPFPILPSLHRALPRPGKEFWSNFDQRTLDCVPFIPGPNIAISGSPDPRRISLAKAVVAGFRERVRACQIQERSSAAVFNSTPGDDEAALIVRDMDALCAAQGDLRVSVYRLSLAVRGVFLPLEMQEKEEAEARAGPASNLSPRRLLPSTAFPSPTPSTNPPDSPPHPVVTHLSTLVDTAPVVSFAGQSFSIYPLDSAGVAACGLRVDTLEDILKVVAHLERFGNPGLASLKSLSKPEDFIDPPDFRTGLLSSLATSVGSDLVLFFLSGGKITSLEAESLNYPTMPQLGMPEDWVPPPPIHILVAGKGEGSLVVSMLLLPVLFPSTSTLITLDLLLGQPVSSHTDIFLFLLNAFLTHFTRPPTHHTPFYPLVFHLYIAGFSGRRLRAHRVCYGYFLCSLPYPLCAHSPCRGRKEC